MKIIFSVVLFLAASLCQAQVAPAVNSAMAGCTNGSNVLYLSSTLACAGGTPTMGSCGVSPSVAGDDYSGAITAGSGVLAAH